MTWPWYSTTAAVSDTAMVLLGAGCSSLQGREANRQAARQLDRQTDS